MKFQCQDPTDDTAVVTIRSGGNDVNLLINDTLVAWFDDEEQCLVLAHPDQNRCQTLERLGVKMTGPRLSRTIQTKLAIDIEDE